jgi:hypothetical protein
LEDKKNFVVNVLKRSIKMFLIITYLTIIISMIAGGISAGIMTLIPPDAFGYTVSKKNYLGYTSTCSFVPFSTIILFGMAIVSSILLWKLIKYLRRKSKPSHLQLESKMLTTAFK